MDTELVGLDKADNSGRLWVVPNRVASIEPCSETPEDWSCLTLAGGHSFIVVGNVEQISKKLRGPTGSLLGMHLPIDLAPRHSSSIDSEIGRAERPDERPADGRHERTAAAALSRGLFAGQTRR